MADRCGYSECTGGHDRRTNPGPAVECCDPWHRQHTDGVCPSKCGASMVTRRNPSYPGAPKREVPRG